ncbi:MAG: hypothetical protein ACXAC5_04690 [Promethearchaeota archaeon]
MMDTINATIKGYDIVVVLGGDNSFTKVSHFIDNNTAILGINSDPERSVGYLLNYCVSTIQSIIDLREIIDFEQFTISEWPRLEATLDGEPIIPATSEYFFGERQRNKMSRHVIVYDGKEYEQKCSGAILATGAGSSGWFKSASGYAPFKPTEQRAMIGITELYNSNSHSAFFPQFVPFNANQEVILYSLNDDDGLVSVDSWDEYKFLRGSEARIRLGKPLNVVVPTMGEFPSG